MVWASVVPYHVPPFSSVSSAMHHSPPSEDRVTSRIVEAVTARMLISPSSAVDEVLYVRGGSIGAAPSGGPGIHTRNALYELSSEGGIETIVPTNVPAPGTRASTVLTRWDTTPK